MSEVSFNADSLKKFGRTKRAATGYYPMACVDAVDFDGTANQGLPPGSMSKLTFKRVSDESDPNSVMKGAPGIGVLVTWPVEIDGQNVLEILGANDKYPDAALRDCAALMASLFPEEVTALPIFDKERKAWFDADGNEVAKAEVQAHKDAANEAGAAKAAEIVAQGAQGLRTLVGRVLFAKVTYKEGNDFPRLSYYSATPKFDVTEGLSEYAGGETQTSEEGGEKPERGTSKSTSKAASKSNGKLGPSSKAKPRASAR